MQDVRRLMVLGHGMEQSAMWESIAANAFLYALDDPALEVAGQPFKLLSSKPTWRARRVIVQKDSVIPAHTQVTVKGRTVYSRLDKIIGN